MTRALHNRLALANIKIKHGWENLSIDAIEPQIDQQLKRKRPTSSADTISDTSSCVSSRFHSLNAVASSPIKPLLFTDNPIRIDSSRSYSHNHSNKRTRLGDFAQYPASSTQTGRKTRSAAAVQSWKRSHKLPESSPVYHTRHAHFPTASHVSKLSFISEGSTVADDTISPEMSEDDDDDLPVHSFLLPSRVESSVQSSPPRTPPPQYRHADKAANISWSRTPRTGEEGADLLMYLATSPTPANYGTAKARLIAPSTPPSKTTPLPSSMMSTPGGGSNGLFGFGMTTPSNNFNFSDFCNVTPSPAQNNWPKTPKTAKTPLTAREARRKLNFDALLPPTGDSPQLDRSAPARNADLSMELGGALVPEMTRP